MSSISYKLPKAFLDTTVLCGALRTDGLNRQLLFLARGSMYYQPVISKVCLFEMYNVALTRGLQGVTYSIEDLDDFMEDVVYPLLEEHNVVNSRVGRYSFVSRLHANRPTGEVLVELTGRTHEEAITIIKSQGMNQPLTTYDPDDLHVWLAAIDENCDYIVTSNTHRFPEQIGRIRRIHPREFIYGILTIE
ncbi:PIN domain-containing protein [Fodinisporobacter ferrooxydans]|uniref:PIN domain-containing protein n=1 Tax=Fodinisporobacter ferrooxydans TaxID=2901836 RepID=A0ABY4CHN2_9BACL|nr:PIN domain-containing protein [Alicyclobacillaceae bacterium MYW30-H2]